jgi:CRP-like cAMP-binding protein
MEMYFIEFGEVRILKKVGAVEVKLDMLDRGKFFGEMSLITGKKRVASAIAITDCKIHTMNKVMFEKNLVNNKVFMKKIIETLAFRLEETNTKLKDHALKVFRLLESRNITV